MIRHLAMAAVCLAACSQISAAGAVNVKEFPGPVVEGGADAVYHVLTGELYVSANNIVNFYVESASNGIVPLASAPVGGPAGALLTNNPSRVGYTNLQQFSFTDLNMGSIGAGLPCADDDLTITFNSRLGGARLTYPVYCWIPEPTSAGLAGLGVVGLLAARRRS